MLQRIFQIINIPLLLLLAFCAKAQVSSVYRDADLYYAEGMEFFENSNFGLAKNKFKEAKNAISSQFDERSKLLARKSEFMHAKSSLLGKNPDGEKLISNFYQQNRPDPLAYLAIKEIANIKYESRLYAEAIEFYNKIDEYNLSNADRSEILFKKGYCHFVKKDFELAEKSFRPILGKQSDYYHATYYYMGMVNFFLKDYESAVKNFLTLENNNLYKDRIPYYVSQIYFAQQQYDQIIRYVPQQIKNPKLKNTKEIKHILGQTYFIQGKYAEALPHLEYFNANSQKMRKEDFYQLAFTHYKLENYENAAENFKELAKLDSQLGQLSNNYLADCYLKIDNKEDARVSFKNVTNYDFDPELKEDATFNYGKLSAELGYDRAAISSLMEIPQSSRSYGQAQNVLASLFESSKDYSMVIKTIEAMPSQAPRIKESYQKVCLELGIQLLKDGQINDAKTSLLKGSKVPVSNYYSTLIYYYLADIFHIEADYIQSTAYLNKYFTISELVTALPENANFIQANYIQGYNYLKQKEYSVALDYFTRSYDHMEMVMYSSSPDQKKRRIYADVISRMGDCYFTANKYAQASKSYEIASNLKFPGQDYAFFQRSMIKGLQGQYYEKIVLLDELVQKVPNSSFIDDAYFQIGETELALGNSSAAELSYGKILSLKGKTNLITRALLKLGLIAYNKGDTNKATEFYTDIFQNNPNKNEAQEALIALEEIYIQDLGQAEKFMQIVEKNTGYKLSTLERDSLSYMAAQGRFENGEYIAAIESYTKYIDRYPNGINRLKALYNRAESNSILKNYRKALPDYEAIIKLGQNDFYEDAIHKAALISYNDLQEFKKAFNYYNLLEQVTDDLVLKYEAQVGGLRSAYRAGDLDAILVMANKVVTSPLANKEDKALANFYSGKMNYMIKSWEPALANLQQVVKLVDNANAAEAKYLINDIYFQTKDYVTAEQNTLETISNSTAYPYWIAKNLILLSDVFMIKTDIFNAKAALEAVIENFQESGELLTEAQEKLDAVLAEEARLNRIEEADATIKLDTIGNNE